MKTKTFIIGLLAVMAVVGLATGTSSADNGLHKGQTGTAIETRVARGQVKGGGSQRNSYVLLVGQNVLADSYQIVYADGTPQDIIDNMNTAAAKASQVSGSRISTAPGTYKITVSTTTEDVCGNACAYWSYDPTVQKMADSEIKIESWSFPMQYAPCLAVHELGHTLGLGHVNDQRQIMNAIWYAGSSPCTWATGDLNGIKAAA
jgi:Matrixin